jgi:serine/threonine protein kinase/tetratricopeptide (TPR) repeat protein
MSLPAPDPKLPATLHWSRLGAFGQPANGDALVDDLAAEMAERWHQGEHILVEDLLDRHPELQKRSEVIVELLFEEICLRQRHGEETAADAVARRFPQWAQQLEMLIACQCLLNSAPSPASFQAVPEKLGDFQLVAELGRGAQGPVFLALQPALADRPVVLKLIARSGEEHLSLARLQHTHIVPLYSVHDFPDRHQLALCMPYFGGTTLAQLLERAGGRAPSQRSGKDLLEALQHAQAAAPIGMAVDGPACRFLARVSYAQAICWIGACLADALQYASERSLVHLDVKPANVLLAADGQPMLLDFHMARAPLVAGTPTPPSLGGTRAYMAPEHEAAITEVKHGGVVPIGVDGRADIYSLGALLYEALGGPIPAPHTRPGRELRRRNPRVTPGLADLLSRCLTLDARDRYPDAAALAADLRRHMTGMPLQGVRNRSLVERMGRWRRHPPVTSVAIAALIALGIAGSLVVIQAKRQLDQARVALMEGQEHRAHYRLGEALSAFKRGLALTESIPVSDELTRQLRMEAQHAESAEVARDLHVLVDTLRPYYGQALLERALARQVEASCRRFWDLRGEIQQRLARHLEPDLTLQFRTDLLDLAILWSDFRVSLAGENDASARRDALEVLDQAETLFGPSSVLDLERAAHIQALGLPVPAQTTRAPRTAWEHCALGRALLRSGNVEAAAVHFQQALESEPGSLWYNLYSGLCAYRQARYEAAAMAFNACVALAPDRAWCFYDRGLAYRALGQFHQARRDFDTAQRLDPTLAQADVELMPLH